ncbi:hypothetical protein UlMin_046205 [Ulmus minor]
MAKWYCVPFLFSQEYNHTTQADLDSSVLFLLKCLVFSSFLANFLRLADTWHMILLIIVIGGVIVGMMHGLVEILDQIKQSSSSHGQGFDLLSGVFPTIKAIQAAITLGIGCSLGPKGPSVDIKKSCANGFSLMMENSRERKIALVATCAAIGISSGFYASFASCFFAIEIVLRPLRVENSPPFTTTMIILASIISSTVSNVSMGTQSAFIVPAYDLKSTAELPLYLILGMQCGVVSAAFTRLVTWFTKLFDFIKEKFGLSTVYPGILYWGFTNVEEILRTRKSALALGIRLLTQLVIAKVMATALCKGFSIKYSSSTFTITHHITTFSSSQLIPYNLTMCYAPYDYYYSSLCFFVEAFSYLTCSNFSCRLVGFGTGVEGWIRNAKGCFLMKHRRMF